MSVKSAAARAAKWLGLGMLALLALLLIGLLVFDWNTTKPYLSAWVTGQTGRQFTIGDIDVDIAPTPRIELRDLRLENAEWGQPRPLVAAELLSFRIDLSRLLQGEIAFPHLQLQGAEILLERGSGGKANWDFVPGPLAAPAVEPVVPEKRPEIPQVAHFDITDTRVAYRSPAFEADLQLDQMRGRMSGGSEGVRAAGSGTLEGKPLDFSLRAGDIQTLRRPDEPYPLSLQVSLGSSNFAAQGTVSDPLGGRGLNLDVTLSGPSLAALHPVVPLPLPGTPVYRLTSRIHRQGLQWTLQALSGAIGRSDIGGEVTIDLAGTRLGLQGALSSRQVYFSDLEGLLGAPPRQPDQRPGRLFPHRPINTDFLQAAEMQLEYAAKQIAGTKIPASNLATAIRLSEGDLQMQLQHAQVAGGTASGRLTVASQTEPLTAAADLRLSGLRLGELIPQTPFADASSGRISGRVDLHGAGRSVAALLGNGDGTAEFAMAGGTLDNTVVEAIGLDIAELLLVLNDEGEPTPIRCAAGIIKINDGIARPDPLIIDTQDSLLEVNGTINLATEQLDLSIRAHAKDPSLATARGSIALAGTLLAPELDLQAGQTAGQIAGAAALAALVNPLAAIAAFIDPGTAEDAACGELLEMAQP